MAEILPFRAFRYNKNKLGEMQELTSPLFDVVSANQRTRLYQNQFNSLHLSVPQPPLAADRASLTLRHWKEQKVLIQDPLPSIYVYHQYFHLDGVTKPLCRKGFICNVRLYQWNENVILRHENTIPKSVYDRIELLEKLEMNVSPTHGMYTDPTRQLEPYMEEAIQVPWAEVVDDDGVRDVLGVIQDASIIQKFIDVIKTKKIILADGHHRYEGSLANQHNQKRANPNHSGKEGYNYHLMFLSNTEADDIVILPTHRLIQRMEIDNQTVLERLGKYFSTQRVEDPFALKEMITGKKWTFGFVLKDASYLITLKPNAIESLKWPFPKEINELDLTVLHYFIIEKTFGIPGKEQRKSEAVSYDRDHLQCIEEVQRNYAQCAILTNPVTIDEVKRVCSSGYTMPQKSTYFYPKLITGLVFGSIKESEFKNSPYSPF